MAITRRALGFFKIFVRPTKLLQASTYPTLNYAILQYLGMLKKLNQKHQDQPDSPIGQACTAASKKLEDYYNISQLHSHSAVATVCDPRFNFNVFNILWPSTTDDCKRAGIKRHFRECYYQYHERERDIATAALQAAIGEATDDLVLDEVDSADELFVPQGRVDADNEWTKWMKEAPVPRNTKILSYWRGKQYEFPTIARMAKDHLAIPASSAASECVFSGGSDLITKKRNQLGGENTRKLLYMRDWGVIKEAVDDSIDLSSE